MVIIKITAMLRSYSYNRKKLLFISCLPNSAASMPTFQTKKI